MSSSAPKTHTIAFTMPDAHKLILSGQKTQTLRMAASRGDVKVGDALILKEWIGKPRRKGSKCIEIVRVKCTEIIGLLVVPNSPFGAAAYPSSEALENIARLDGFPSWKELEAFLVKLYGKRRLDMVGIRWKAPEEAKPTDG